MAQSATQSPSLRRKYSTGFGDQVGRGVLALEKTFDHFRDVLVDLVERLERIFAVVEV